MTPNVTKAAQLARVRRLIDFYESGDIPRLTQHEVNPGLQPGSRENYLYFTLSVCINFQRNSPAMWASALATWNDPETRYVFFPELLAQRSVEQIRADMVKHRLALQPNKHVVIWKTIAASLHEYYHDDPREFIKEANSDAAQLIQLLQVIYRKRFPYLSGLKLSNYWPFILSHYTDVAFTNMQAISIIPDTRIIQSSVRLGLVGSNATPLQVEAAWRDLLQGSDIMPVRLHPVLWNWSRNKFLPIPD